MVAFTEILRAHFIEGYNDIPSSNLSTFKGWISNTRYTISSQIQKNAFELEIEDPVILVSAFAYDINRMASSSFESINGISPENKFPKSVGWLMIRIYYSAYFAAHAILRFFGISCSSIDSFQVRKINEAAELYCFRNNINLSEGYYECKFVKRNYKKLLICRKLDNTHQDFWKVFLTLLEDLSLKISNSPFLKQDRDDSMLLLDTIMDRLTNDGKNKTGSWLSKIRNEINYTHSMGTWFPYQGFSGTQTDLFRALLKWKDVPNFSFFTENQRNDALKYVETCVIIVSISKELIVGLNKTNPKSFLQGGAMKCLNFCK